MILNILVFLTSLSLILLFKSLIEDNEGLQVMSIISIVMIVLIGWLMVGISMDKTSIEVKQTPLEIVKGKHIGILVFETHKFIIDGYQLEKISDKAIYSYKIGYNIYNYVTDTTLIIK